ncbi:hypothetical protein [Hathewaya limosa]|uniref:Ribose 5-phosphate isomerase n=1 Tax=Hathewaya limosa TaxID=1536 RepID=A0ABU0JMS9_HATLI|nr:hypothetical protein [Hathewaya limosa]MDQ0478381.1 hypothetical protein [Hathewaya limosa]
MFCERKYENIINILCKAKGVSKKELMNVLEEEECEYLLFLLLKKYNCLDEERLMKDFNLKNVENKSKIAEEKFFVNHQFREGYFEVLNHIKKIG